MKTTIIFFLATCFFGSINAQENSKTTISVDYNGANVIVKLHLENQSDKNKVDFNVYRFNKDTKESLIYSLKGAENRPNWTYSDTLKLPDGIYVYRMEIISKGKLLVNESVILNRFEPGSFPGISNFSTNGSDGNQKITLKWTTKNQARIRNLQLERKNSFEKDFKMIALLNPSDSVYVDSVVIPNEAYFYRFIMPDLVTDVNHNSATVHYVPTFDVVPYKINDLNASLKDSFPTLTWKNDDEKSRGFYVFKLDQNVGFYKQVSTIVLPDSLGNCSWLDNESQLQEGATYNYYVLAESHSYTKGASSDTVSIYIPADKIVLSPPQDIQLLKTFDGKFQLMWEIDSTRIDEIGYFEVFRKKPNQTNFESSQECIVTYDLNYLQIENPEDGEVFAVKSGNGENRSALSIPFTYNDAFQNDFGPSYIKAEVIDDELWIKWNSPENEDLTEFKLYKLTNESFEVVETIKGDTNVIKTKKYLAGENNTYYLTAITKRGKESSGSKMITVF